MKIKISKHALERMILRNITKKIVLEIVENPDYVISQSAEIRVYSKIVEEGNKLYPYRVFVTSG